MGRDTPRHIQAILHSLSLHSVHRVNRPVEIHGDHIVNLLATCTFTAKPLEHCPVLTEQQSSINQEIAIPIASTVSKVVSVITGQNKKSLALDPMKNELSASIGGNRDKTNDPSRARTGDLVRSDVRHT